MKSTYNKSFFITEINGIFAVEKIIEKRDRII